MLLKIPQKRLGQTMNLVRQMMMKINQKIPDEPSARVKNLNQMAMKMKRKILKRRMTINQRFCE